MIQSYTIRAWVLFFTIVLLVAAAITAQPGLVWATASTLFIYFILEHDEAGSPLLDLIKFFGILNLIRYLRSYGDGWSDVCIYTSRIAGPFEELRSTTRR